MNDLLKGAYDLHVHSAPDVMPRRVDDIDVAQRFIAAGMRGFAIKSHYFCTAQRAETIRKIYPQCNAIGTISLNNAVGGINPMAVEMAGRAGAKIVWFPTVDAENELKRIDHTPPEKLAFWAKIALQIKAEGIISSPINILENGKLKKEVFDVLDTIAKYNMVLATGHVSHEEIFPLVRACKACKVQRILVTHATFPSTFYTIDEQRELIGLGAFIEHAYTTPVTGKVSWNTVIEQIRAIGSKHVVIGTDLGQPTAAFPDEGVAHFAEVLIQNGFSEKEVKDMIANNPASLVE